MPTESADHIGQLNPAWPLGSDGRNTADDQIRMFKGAVKGTFPNVAGPITATHTELNYVDGVTGPIQAQLDDKIDLDDPALTALIKAQGFQFASIVTLAVNTMLAATHVGKLVVVSGASGGVQLVLPLISVVAGGAPINVLNVSSQIVTVIPSGSNNFSVLPSGNPASILLQPGDSLEVVANATTNAWHVTGGTAAIVYSSSFDGVKTGYQKFPNGMMKQWGSATGTGASVTFPVPFVGNPAALQLTPTSTSGPTAGKVYGAEAVNVSSTGFSPYTYSITTSGTPVVAAESHTCAWEATGAWK